VTSGLVIIFLKSCIASGIHERHFALSSVCICIVFCVYGMCVCNCQLLQVAN